MGYLITFNTYGTWLHGDERGSVDRHGNNIPGTSVIPPNQKLLKLKKTKLKQPPVTLTDAQRKSIKVTIQEVIKHNNWKLHALNALTEHIHIVLTAPKPPDPIMNSLKSWCTHAWKRIVDQWINSLVISWKYSLFMEWTRYSWCLSLCLVWTRVAYFFWTWGWDVPTPWRSWFCMFDWYVIQDLKTLR